MGREFTRFYNRCRLTVFGSAPLMALLTETVNRQPITDNRYRVLAR